MYSLFFGIDYRDCQKREMSFKAFEFNIIVIVRNCDA